MMRTILFGLAGASCAIAWFVFFDGLTFAERDGLPYNFVMWLPGIFSLLATFVFMFADPRDLSSDDSADMMMMGGGGGGSSDEKANKARIIFFLGACLSLAALSVAIWKITDTYSSSSESWPGVALILQSLALALMNGLILGGRGYRGEDEMSFF